MRYFVRVLKYLRPYKKLAATSILIIVVSSFVGLLTPWPLKVIVDSVLGDHSPPQFISDLLGGAAGNRFTLLGVIIAASLLLSLLNDGLQVFASYVDSKIDMGMALDFRSDLFAHAQRLSMTFHDHRRSGSLIYAINYQADAAARLVMTVPPLAQSVLTLVGMTWITYTINPKLALLSLTVVPVLYYCVRYYVRNIQERLMTVKGMEGQTISIIHEAISMLRVIVAFGREDYEFRRFREQGERARDARVRLTVRQTLFSLAVNTTTAVGTVLVLGYGSYLTLQGHLTAGELLVVIAYIAAVYQPLESISTTAGSLQDTITSLRIAFELLDTQPEIADPPDAVEIKRARGHVQFEAVDFSYTGRVDTLRDISFEVQPGQVIALVGPTGAGKTTLISLIPRFYEAKRGRVLIDGIDTHKLKLRSLRDQVSLVLQEPLLFSGSIADNIRYGRLEAEMEEVIQAAKDANAHDFIMRLPQQYGTELGERGVQLSGGERQRICVARAFLKDAPILILDEPTSSIDSKTEAVILDALDQLMVGRTTFMVAHRLSTVRHADRIIVLDKGRIVEQGTHEELLQRGGLYRDLYERQNRARERREARLVLEPVGAAD